MSKSFANFQQPIPSENMPVIQSNRAAFLQPINKNVNNINGIPIDPSDPNFLEKLNKSLPKNQEIKVKRIYHVNKPMPEPEPEPENQITNIETKTEQKVIENDELASTEESDDDSRLSYISNPASVIRKNTNIKVRNKYKFIPVPYSYCAICDMEMRRRSIDSYHGFHGYYPPYHDPYMRSHSRMSSCSICNPHLLNNPPKMNHANYAPYPHHENSIHSYFNPYHNQKVTNLPPINSQNIRSYEQSQLPPIANSRLTPSGNKTMSNPALNSAFRNSDTARSMNGIYDYNKAPNSYKELHHNRNRLIDYTYDKYNPRNDDRSSKVLKIYRDRE